MSKLGVVVIGRNEGERLRRGLDSVIGQGTTVVYVDSASTDGSPEMARDKGVDVVDLDMSVPFTAAMGRGRGFQRLLEIEPDVEFVQFIDGDCEVEAGWLEIGRRRLEERPDLAAVTGRRRERFPERSVYNKLADIDWDTPIGEAKTSHGDMMIRVKAYQDAGGYDPAVVVAEEFELCIRMRQQGWKIERLDAPMTIHDMDMTRFGQWWKRSRRTGYGFAEGIRLHGGPPERHYVRETRSVLFWGLLIPVVALVLVWPTRGLSLLLFLLYPLLYFKIKAYCDRKGMPKELAKPFAFFCVIGKFPQLAGMFQFWREKLVGARRRLIEYRDVKTIESDPVLSR